MSKILVSDAGHDGKYNRSPVVPEYYESDMNWKLHLLQKKYLEEYDFIVLTTRGSQNEKMSLEARGKQAEGSVLFFSTHSNAAADESMDYVAVYCLVDDDSTEIDEISRQIAEKLAPVIAEVMGTEQGFKVLTRKSSNDRNNDGVMNDNYYGILHAARVAGVPALILEHSFHTNTRMTNWLLDDNNLDKLARAEAAVIAECFDMEKSESIDTSKLYRVQVGAFSKLANAEVMRIKVEKAGFDTYMVQKDGLYKVQVGAYANKANAENTLAKIKAAGFDTYITDEGGQGVSSVVKKAVEEIAAEVIDGKWGNGDVRRKNLEAAGYNYAEVQRVVNKLV